jgi:hypothetical protein
LTAAKLLLAAVAALLLAGSSAGAVKNGYGDLVVSFDGGIHPTRLPRQQLAPVSVRVAGNAESASGEEDQLPQLRRITVAINRQGHLFDRGLPVCHVEAIQPSTEAAARHICGDAIVGSGHVAVQVRIPSQLPFLVRARLLAFNGPRREGHKLILAQVYARDPPGAFILTFRVGRREGTYGTVLSTSLPAGTRQWAYLTHFDMTLHRTYTYRGQSRSFVSAACAAPEGFDRILFPFARATYLFAGVQKRLTMSKTGSCSVAE